MIRSRPAKNVVGSTGENEVVSVAAIERRCTGAGDDRVVAALAQITSLPPSKPRVRVDPPPIRLSPSLPISVSAKGVPLTFSIEISES